MKCRERDALRFDVFAAFIAQIAERGASICA